MTNLLDELPAPGTDEHITELLRRPGIRIERIVSHGQVTSPDAPYDQPHDEWVLLLAGAARLWIDGDEGEGGGECELRPGDTLMIPAHRRHRVTWTRTDGPTIWLALHLDAS